MVGVRCERGLIRRYLRTVERSLRVQDYFTPHTYQKTAESNLGRDAVSVRILVPYEEEQPVFVEKTTERF